MDFTDLFNGLELQNNFPLDDYVCPEAFFKAYAFVNNRHRHLTLQAQSSPLQFSGQHHLIDRLKQPGTKFTMHLYSGINHYPADFVLRHLGVLASWRESMFFEVERLLSEQAV